MAGNLPAYQVGCDHCEQKHHAWRGRRMEQGHGQPFCLRHHSSDSGRRDVANDFGKRLPEIAFQNPNAIYDILASEGL